MTAAGPGGTPGERVDPDLFAGHVASNRRRIDASRPPTPHRLSAAAWTDLADAAWTDLAGAALTLLVPLGSTEQHGPHLPLDTDTRIAVAVARRAAAAAEPGVVVAPALAYGASGEHAGFPGTLSMGTAALEHVLVEIGRSAGPEVRRLLFVNGHGGNAEALAAAVGRLRAEGRPARAWSPQPVPGGDAHAGWVETAVMLALDPGAVRLERAEPGNRRPLAELWPELRAGGVAPLSANGVLGDPTRATAEAGAAILRSWVSDLIATFRSAPAVDDG